MQHVVPGVIRPMRILWNEVIGFIFLCIGVIATPRVVKELMNFDGAPEQLGRLAVSGLFLITMYGFGAASFWKARKIKRS